MELALSPTQAQIAQTARDLLRQQAGPAAIRRVLGSGAGWDQALWRALGELGFCSLLVPEEFGGAGLGAMEMALVLEETGRALAITPFFETAVLTARLLALFGSDAQKRRDLPAIASGAARATVVGLGTRPALADGKLSGEAGGVSFAAQADIFAVIAACGTLCTVAADAPWVRVTPTPCLDETRPVAHVSFDATPVATEHKLPPHALQAWMLEAGAFLAAEQTGGAQFCLDSAVDHARQRVQFGRPIGSFQAIKHMLADMMVRVEASRSAVWHAAAAIDAGGEAQEACAIARAWASEAFHACAGDAIQVHGGMGFTWDHHAHRYFKRARATLSWFASPTVLREEIAARLLDAAA